MSSKLGNADVPSKRSSIAPPKFLLDEHYPEWLAQNLRERGIDAVSLVKGRGELLGADDTEVLRSATAEGRVVVTEDVRTFGVAVAQVDDHVGVIYCHHRRFPRTRPGLKVLEESLVLLVNQPPLGIGEAAVIWWLEV